MTQHLSADELQVELCERPGLIPTGIDIARCHLEWLDLKRFHCYSGFFHESLALHKAIHPLPAAVFTSGFDVLHSVKMTGNWGNPTAFIFHAGRSGSTLLAKVIARSRSNLVLSEAAPHNLIWAALPHWTGPPLESYRRLVRIMGRPRLPSYRAHIIKFTSFNIVHFRFIRAAFPETPALFLFRNPAELLESYRLNQPGWMGKDIGQGKIWSSSADAVKDFFLAALSIQDRHFRSMDYAHLTRQRLPSILRFLNIESSTEDMRQMQAEFAWDAKSGHAARLFVPSKRDAPAVSETLRELYAALRLIEREHWREQAQPW